MYLKTVKIYYYITKIGEDIANWNVSVLQKKLENFCLKDLKYFDRETA